MNTKFLRVIAFVIFTLFLLLISPVIARIGSMQTMRTWNSTPGALGVSRPLTLSVRKYVAYVDVFGQYPFYSLFITDGGYGYVYNFEIPSSNAKAFVQGCSVVWQTNRVEFIMPAGETLIFPAQVVIQQIGP